MEKEGWHDHFKYTCHCQSYRNSRSDLNLCFEWIILGVHDFEVALETKKEKTPK